MKSEYPKVGAAVFILKNGKILMLKRKGAHGEGTWGLPGGHLEFGESWEEGVRRETTEEVGVMIANIQFLAVTNDVFEKEERHYVTIFMTADWKSGESVILEPNSANEIGWFTYQTMPKNVFLPIKNLRNTYPNLII